jgi:predicted dehydrogenase
MLSFAHGHAYGYAGALMQLPNAEIVGVADLDKDRGEDAAKRYSARQFASYEELLSADIDAVVICTENIYHREVTEMAAAAGKHVLCEKPLCTSIADGRAMIEACKKAGVKLQTAFPCRFAPNMIQGREAILSGKIGKVLAIKGTNQGSCPGSWFTDITLSGGGAVIDHTVHVVDLMRWTLGAEITEVYAEVSNLMAHKNYDDAGILSFAFDNGVFATLDPSWSRVPSYPTWGNVTMFFTGEEGSIWIDEFNQHIDFYNDRVMRHTWEYYGDNFDLGLCRSFVNAIANDAPVEITGEDGLAAAAVALAAYESAKRQQPVKLSEIGF